MCNDMWKNGDGCTNCVTSSGAIWGTSKSESIDALTRVGWLKLMAEEMIRVQVTMVYGYVEIDGELVMKFGSLGDRSFCGQLGFNLQTIVFGGMMDDLWSSWTLGREALLEA
ncbi:hypothetical protein Tco_1247491 [Tanacetum coccineum]